MIFVGFDNNYANNKKMSNFALLKSPDICRGIYGQALRLHITI